MTITPAVIDPSALITPILHLFLNGILVGFTSLSAVIISMRLVLRFTKKAVNTDDYIYVTPSMTTDAYKGNYGYVHKSKFYHK